LGSQLGSPITGWLILKLPVATRRPPAAPWRLRHLVAKVAITRSLDDAMRHWCHGAMVMAVLAFILAMKNIVEDSMAISGT